LARGLVLEPEVMLFDEPDSGLDPVRTAYLNQLIVDLNERTDSTFLIVTHDINTARTLPDNIGIIYHKHLAMFGPREQLLTSEDPVVSQFLNGRREGPIGMSEEKDADEQAAEQASGAKRVELPPLRPQLAPMNGHRRAAEDRRLDRVMAMLTALPQRTRDAVTENLSDEQRRHYGLPAGAPVGDRDRAQTRGHDWN
jgi:phospholipid/cholesterol/gamma-HCH transport system ATP-binding protein